MPIGEHREDCNGDDENEEASYLDYESIKLLIKDVETLQTQLNACNDEDEQHALEEDITGKILLACWCGVQSELKRVLTKVIDCVVQDKDVDRSVHHSRATFLSEIANEFRAAAMGRDFDDRDYLWRITTDAEAGISKHALLLAARQHARDMASTSEPPENVTTPTCMSRALQGATPSSIASTDTMLVPDSSTPQGRTKRSREQGTDAHDGDRPLNRSRTDDHAMGSG